MKRVLAPLGGAITLAIVAVLVLGGLTWLTIESLHIESEQRLARARANAAQSERLALWRLDGRLFPAWGVENNRGYAHYFASYTQYPIVLDVNGEPVRVHSPLLFAELPEWMKLHFQLDPETGWESPQVQRDDDPSLAAQWRALYTQMPQDVTARRSDALQELRQKFPAKTIHDQLLRFETMNPDDSPLGGVPYPHEKTIAKTQKLNNETFPGQMTRVNESATQNAVVPPQSDLSKPGALKSIKDQDPRSLGGDIQLPIEATPPNSATQQQRNAPSSPQPTNRATSSAPGQPAVQSGGYDARADLARKVSEFRGGENNTLPPLPLGGSNSVAPAIAAPAPAGPPPAPSVADMPAPKVSDEKKRDLERKSEVDKAKASKEAPSSRGKQKIEHSESDDQSKSAGTAGLGQSPVDQVASQQKSNQTKTIEYYQALLISLRPPTVQLGPMRPVWLKAPGGDEALVLVRAARLEHKIVFQGVLLDWPRLQEVLTEEVRTQLPQATVMPVHDETPHERCMTALPAALEPGPEPEPPPAGWTPLRVGLLLSWIAALFGLAAVGFFGWTLINLSEKRIRFVSAVTHELRTPLTAMRLYTDLLSSGMIADEAKQKEYLRTLGHESERLNTLIENVLDFARLEKRSVQAHRLPIPVTDLLTQVRQTWSERLANEGRELVVISTLPQEQTVTTDARIAGQIIGILVDNARKYSRDAEEKRIWLWAKPGNNAIVLEVEDRGPGIAAGECGSIFKPFRRGQNVSATGGAGLGLALAKQWTDLLGGKLSYRPASGGTGACFCLELPI